MRLPTTSHILHKFITSIPIVVMLHCHRSLGEICLKSGFSAESIIRRQDLSFVYDAGKVNGASITIRHYKNNLKQLPVALFLPKNYDNVFVVQLKRFCAIVLNILIHLGLLCFMYASHPRQYKAAG